MQEYEKPNICVMDVVVVESSNPRTEIGISSNNLPDEDEDW